MCGNRVQLQPHRQMTCYCFCCGSCTFLQCSLDAVCCPSMLAYGGPAWAHQHCCELDCTTHCGTFPAVCRVTAGIKDGQGPCLPPGTLCRCLLPGFAAHSSHICKTDSAILCMHCQHHAIQHNLLRGSFLPLLHAALTHCVAFVSSHCYTVPSPPSQYHFLPTR